MREFDLNATGNRANDELAQKLFQGGEQTVSLNTEEARRYLDDPRFRLMDPQTGRRLTRQQLEARIKAADTEEKIHQVQAALQSEVDEYQHLINFWKPLPQIPSREDWAQAQEKKPFEPQISAPAEPDWVECQAKLLEELTEKHAAAGLGKLLPHFLSKQAAEKEFPTAWPEREAQLQNAHAQQVQEYEQRLAQESATWDQLETDRVAWIRRLLAGDLEEVHHTVAEALQGLRFPFKTHCDFFLKDPRFRLRSGPTRSRSGLKVSARLRWPCTRLSRISWEDLVMSEANLGKITCWRANKSSLREPIHPP